LEEQQAAAHEVVKGVGESGPHPHRGGERLDLRFDGIAIVAFEGRYVDDGNDGVAMVFEYNDISSEE
jgi:hypothetical protein